MKKTIRVTNARGKYVDKQINYIPVRYIIAALLTLFSILAIIGGLNWGSIGIFGFDLVAFAFGGSDSAISRVIYTLVGLSAVWCISLLFRDTEAARENT